MHFKKIICHHKVVERCVPVFNKFFMKKIIARAEKKKAAYYYCLFHYCQES